MWKRTNVLILSSEDTHTVTHLVFYVLLSKCEILYRTKEVVVQVRAVWDGSGPYRVCICVCVCVGCNKFLSSLCRHERLGRQPEQKPLKQKRDDVRLRPSQHRTDQSGLWILATPTLGPPFFPWCPGPRGQHLQRATVGVGRTSHHWRGRRSYVRRTRRVKAKNSTRSLASFALRIQHGIFRLSRTVRLQTRAWEEKPWSDGSDWKNLWRR